MSSNGAYVVYIGRAGFGAKDCPAPQQRQVPRATSMPSRRSVEKGQSPCQNVYPVLYLEVRKQKGI